MIGNRALAMAMLAMTAGAGAQQAATTVQQDFQAAETIDAGTDAAAAVAAWEQLSRRTVANRRSHAIVTTRLASALARAGREQDAVTAARAGLAGLPAEDTTLAADRWKAWMVIAQAAQRGLDYAGAADALVQAEKTAIDPSQRFSTLLSMVQVTTFTDPDAAMAAAGRLDALVASAKVDAKLRGRVADARGLLLLNRGDIDGARAATAEAVRLQGGLTNRTDLYDVAARSDAAIAQLLAGRDEEARRYMAMTGAGRLPKGQFDPAADMTPPDCGGEAGLKPADMAVVEFSIAEDGTVAEARPVYAAGGGAVALEFARAAQRWSWRPEQVAQMPLFFRSLARVEMRCTQAFPRPSIGDGLRGEVGEWLIARQIALPDEERGNNARAVVAQRAALAAAERAGQPPLAPLPAIVQLIENPVIGREEGQGLARRGLALTLAAGAPPAVRLYFDRTVRLAGVERPSPRKAAALLGAMAVEPAYAADPRARAALRLMLADADDKAVDRNVTVLRQVADDVGLAATDPLKVGALIRLASIAQRRDDAAGARAAFARSGLAASQCALLDSPPRLLRAGGTFPEEARRWGFEGWTRSEFDIAADGKVAGVRAILSYPPFVFTRAGQDTIRTAQFAKTFRPDGGVGCGAINRNVRFVTGG